jgi:hypothetical protein
MGFEPNHHSEVPSGARMPHVNEAGRPRAARLMTSAPDRQTPAAGPAKRNSRVQGTRIPASGAFEGMRSNYRNFVPETNFAAGSGIWQKRSFAPIHPLSPGAPKRWRGLRIADLFRAGRRQAGRRGRRPATTSRRAPTQHSRQCAGGGYLRQTTEQRAYTLGARVMLLARIYNAQSDP